MILKNNFILLFEKKLFLVENIKEFIIIYYVIEEND